MYIHQKSKQELSFKKVNNLFLNAVSSLRTVSLTGNDTFPHHRACLTRVPLIPLLAWYKCQEKTLGKTRTLYAHGNALWDPLSHECMCVCSVVHYNVIISRVECKYLFFINSRILYDPLLLNDISQRSSIPVYRDHSQSFLKLAQHSTEWIYKSAIWVVNGAMIISLLHTFFFSHFCQCVF